MSDYTNGGLRDAPHLVSADGFRWVGFTLMTPQEIAAEGWRLAGDEWIPGPLYMFRAAAKASAKLRNDRIAASRDRRAESMRVVQP